VLRRYIQLRTGNLLVPILIHTLFDVVGFMKHLGVFDRLDPRRGRKA
jgi:membrane protease YdiL (CAAX protease family)